jgi:NADPH-dependent 2,4-dienoyl-CoA reductase/sulfur reductase-like enzyme
MTPLSRRAFLGAAAAPLVVGARRGEAPGEEGAQEIAADLVVVGGGFGGCAAALAACRAGLDVVMTEETD